MNREYREFTIDDPFFLHRLTGWLSMSDPSVLLYTHKNNYSHHWALPDCEVLAACGSLSDLQGGERKSIHTLGQYHNETGDWLFGCIAYDLKNELENLRSEHPDYISFPLLHFFQPELIFMLDERKLRILFPPAIKNPEQVKNVFEEISSFRISDSTKRERLIVKARMTKKEYLEKVLSLKNHIKRGDIYEVNLCQEFYAESAEMDPSETFLKLMETSPAPFSCWYRFHDKYLICSSPERFLNKKGVKIISQPIKGTAPRGTTPEEDLQIIRHLGSNPKERSENIMIVDLVRNDLSRIAARGTVRVEELCGIYAFPQVHQMISTVSAELSPSRHWTEAIRACFPMGSMTGAPKIRAMELIEKFEKTRRGLYSGTVGFVTPEGDFDFNVVIRSILYNSTSRYLSFQTGGAITWESDPEAEYRECILKAKGMLTVLNGEIEQEGNL